MCKQLRWSPIPGGPYEVSSDGDVRRRLADGGTAALSPGVCPSTGYKRVNLHIGNHEICRVHRLVAEAFLGNAPEDHNEVNHLDGDKTNNCVDNLEFTSRSENMKHAWEIGLMHQGSDHVSAKLTETRVRIARLLFRWGFSVHPLAERWDVDVSGLYKAVRGDSWSHVPGEHTPRRCPEDLWDKLNLPIRTAVNRGAIHREHIADRGAA